jgi:outer membrane protein TolC
MASLRRALLVSLALGFWVGERSATAEEPYQVPEEFRQPPVLPDEAEGKGARSLGLKDAIVVAVQQNLGITLSREQSVSADQNIGVALGKFEPSVSGLYSHGDSNFPPPLSLVQQGVNAVSLNIVGDTWNLGLSQQLQTGTLLGVSMGNSRALTTPGGDFPLIYNSTLTFQLTQPLLKNFAFDLDVPRADVLRARIGSARSRQDVRAAMLAAVHATEDTYWDLVAALRSYGIQRESAQLATEQRRLTQKQIDAGILAPSDLISAEGTLAQRELALLQAEAAIGTAADRFRRVLNLPSGEWPTAVLPTDPLQFTDQPVELATAHEIALRNRPEIVQKRVDVDRADLDAHVAATNLLPQLDVGFSYGLAGQRGTYSDTLDQLFSNDVPAWTASVIFNWTPLMRAARAQLAALRAGQRAARTQLDQQRVDLYVELREDIRQLDFAARQVRAAARFRDLAVRALDAEQRKFINGTSNNIFIAQRQSDLAQARQAELSALIGHQKAETALQAAMGVLLENRGIRLDVSP